MSVTINWGAHPLEVPVPPGWRVRFVKKVGQPLTRGQIGQALDSPVGTGRIEDIVRGANRVAIVVEDHTRPMFLGDIVSLLLERLNEAGVDDHRVVVVGATAAHRRMMESDFTSKLGSDVVARVRVASHDAFGDNVYIGTTSRGTPVWINRLVVTADAKIAVGSVLPHGSVGFGGGAKLLVPGVAGYDTIAYNHTRLDNTVRVGGMAERPMRLDMEEAARMVGLDFYVGYVMDMDLRICAMAAGDPVEAQRVLAAWAESFYWTVIEPEADVVVACAWPLDLDLFQCGKGLFPAVPFVRSGGTLVWAARCPEGRGCHHLVEKDEAYRRVLLEAFRAAAGKARVIFTSPGVEEQVARELIPPEIEVISDTRRALEEAFRRSCEAGLVTVLYSSPMTVGRYEGEGCVA